MEESTEGNPGASKGSISQVTFVEVTLDDSFVSHPVAGGECLLIDYFSWNTLAAGGEE